MSATNLPPGVCPPPSLVVERATRNGDPGAPGTAWVMGCSLALAELEALARARLSVLLALLHARVAGQQPLASEQSAQRLILLQQRAGDRHAQRTGLAGEAAAVTARHHAVLGGGVGERQREERDLHQRLP